MQVNIHINDNIVDELYLLYNSDDINYIFNQILSEKLIKNNTKIKDFFGKVEFFEDYDYKALRHRNDSIG